MTGTGLVRTTPSASLPMTARARPRRPCVPSTMRSARQRFACATMISATGRPSVSASTGRQPTPALRACASRARAPWRPARAARRRTRRRTGATRRRRRRHRRDPAARRRRAEARAPPSGRARGRSPCAGRGSTSRCRRPAPGFAGTWRPPPSCPPPIVERRAARQLRGVNGDANSHAGPPGAARPARTVLARTQTGRAGIARTWESSRIRRVSPVPPRAKCRDGRAAVRGARGEFKRHPGVALRPGPGADQRRFRR